MSTSTASPSTASEGAVGLFIVSYKIGGHMPGAPTFTVHLTVDTPRQSVTGVGRITKRSINPPLDLSTKLEGDFTWMTVMPNNSTILVTLTGYPPFGWPANGGLGPVIPPNTSLRMVLDENWASGTASYRYTTDGVNWQSVNDAPVEKIPSPTDTADAAPGAEQTVVLSPGSVTASWSGGKLVVHAEGREDGVGQIRVERLFNEIWPPQFSVVGVRTAAIGNFPYAVTGSFDISPAPQTILIVSPLGPPKSVPVQTS